MLVEKYISEIGMATADTMKFALYSVLKTRYEKEHKLDFAGKLAAAVANYLFEGDPSLEAVDFLGESGMDKYNAQRERLDFAKRNLLLVESCVNGMKEWADENLCTALTCAVYNSCYGKYVQGGGRIGFLFSKFLGYVRALQKHDYKATEFLARQMPPASITPLLILVKSRLWRNLPNTPDSKELYAIVAAYAKKHPSEKRPQQASNGARVSTNEEEKSPRAIVQSVGGQLAKPGSGLVSGVLKEPSSLGAHQGVAPSAEKARILVCDDEEGIVEVISAVLVTAGYEVRSTLNSLEAIEIAREFKPHVAFLGEIMPRMDGFKLGLELKSFLPQTRIIMTGEAEPSDLELFHSKGWAFDILVCPFQKEELLGKTRDWVGEACGIPPGPH